MKRLSIFILMIFLCLFCSCGAQNTAGNENEASLTSIKVSESDFYIDKYKKISAEQAKAIMDESRPYILLDVRTDEEFKESRIEGAVLIPDYEIKGRAEAELPDKDALILVYCRSGRRSANAAYDLIDMGYTNVYDFGGIIDWTYETAGG
ncbi:MAG: rhodanese-like domain-containing protein [Oscillospiraceae bacterium]|nr:rhodanese-like domain-containing protein [Oscillospiraceae bacterium]